MLRAFGVGLQTALLLSLVFVFISCSRGPTVNELAQTLVCTDATDQMMGGMLPVDAYSHTGCPEELCEAWGLAKYEVLLEELALKTTSSAMEIADATLAARTACRQAGLAYTPMIDLLEMVAARIDEQLSGEHGLSYVTVLRSVLFDFGVPF